MSFPAGAGAEGGGLALCQWLGFGGATSAGRGAAVKRGATLIVGYTPTLPVEPGRMGHPRGLKPFDLAQGDACASPPRGAPAEMPR